MKFVIDIPEEAYKLRLTNPVWYDSNMDKAIRNGTPFFEELEKIKEEIIGSCNNIAQEVSDLSYTRKIYVYEQLTEIKNVIDMRISELEGE